MRRPLVRRLDRRLDRAGLLRFDAASQQYPSSGAEFTALTGLTASSLYLFDEASGDLIDRVGAVNLPVALGTPLYNQSEGGRRTIKYESSEGHGADVHAFGTTSAWFAAVASVPAGSGTIGIVGRSNAGLTEGAWIYLQIPASGTIGAIVRDDGAGSAVFQATGLDTRGKGLMLIQGQIDRAAAQARIRVSSVVGVGSGSGSIAGFSTLDGASQRYQHGYLLGIGSATNSHHAWGAVATGVQCEGASLLQNVARALGWE